MPKYRRKAKKSQIPYDNNKKGNPLDREKPLEDSEDTEESFTCVKCSKFVEQVIQCEYCLKWYCCTCQNVPDGMMSALIDYKSLHWFCSDCEPTILTKLSCKRKPSEVANPPTNGHEIANTIINGITEPLKNMMENLVKPITESLQILKGSLQPAQVVTSRDTNATSEEVRVPVAKDTTTQAIDEYMDRERRKCNIIIHSMPEETPSQDHEKVGSLLESEFDVPKLSISSITWLGKSSGNKPRLMLVALDKEQHKRTIIKKATKLRESRRWNTIYVSPDLTIKEREINKALRDELKRRKENGEQNLIIKRGRIVSKGNNFQLTNRAAPSSPSAQPMDSGGNETS